MAVTVAVVSYDTRALLLRCLRSLAADARAGHADVWVLDNGSSDGSAAAARSAAPWATVVEASSNLGFGPAVNHIAERTSSDWLLIANADIAMEPEALRTLVLAGGSAPRVGCVAPRLVLPDGSTQHSVHPFPTLPLTLAFNLGVLRLMPALADRLCIESFWDPDRARSVPWALGACLLLRRAAFEEVGRFDERQWMYAEDVDLCWRLHRAGWTTRYEPAASVLHEGSAAAAEAFGEERTERFVTATYTMLARRRGLARTLATAVINIAGAAARVVLAAVPALVSARRRAVLRDHAAWLHAHLHAARRCSTLARSR